MLSSSLWLPETAADRTLTSGTLDQSSGADDRITLWCAGERVADFTVPEGQGEGFLRDCGLVRQ